MKKLSDMSSTILSMSIAAFLVWIPTTGFSADKDKNEIKKEDQFRKRASREYEDPAAFYFVHGYVTSVYQNFGDGFHGLENIGGNQGTQNTIVGDGPGGTPNNFKVAPGFIGRPGNITLANKSGSTFSFDGAIMIGSEVSEDVNLVTEFHIVNDNLNNGFAKNIIFTQGNVRWQILDSLRLTTGRFWSPIAGSSEELLSAQNELGTVPQARYALPNAFGDGAMLDFAHVFSGSKLGLNASASVVNGNDDFDGPTGGSFDTNDQPTFWGRIGIIPKHLVGLGKDDSFELGYSIATGVLRDGSGGFDGSQVSPTAVDSEYMSHAIDWRFKTGRFGTRGYAIQTTEKIEDGPELMRQGIMGELTLRLFQKKSALGGSLDLNGRYDYLERDGLLASEASNGATLDEADSLSDQRISGGLAYSPEKDLEISGEYHKSLEGGDFTEVDDDGFLISVDLSF